MNSFLIYQLQSVIKCSKQVKNLFFFHQPRCFASTSQESIDLVQPITLRTCVGLYPELRKIWPDLYPKSAPIEGIDLTVDYADTATEFPPGTHFDKTIVAVHGNPGYLIHFEQLLERFRGSRIRVVVPNLPNFGHTRSSGLVFWHSTAEKVTFLKDFLKRLQIDKIDCLVGHSFAIQTVAALWENVMVKCCTNWLM